MRNQDSFAQFKGFQTQCETCDEQHGGTRAGIPTFLFGFPAEKTQQPTKSWGCLEEFSDKHFEDTFENTHSEENQCNFVLKTQQ